MTYALVKFGFPIDLSGFAFVAIAALRLKPFLPVFRRLSPDRPEVE